MKNTYPFLTRDNYLNNILVLHIPILLYNRPTVILTPLRSLQTVSFLKILVLLRITLIITLLALLPLHVNFRPNSIFCLWSASSRSSRSIDAGEVMFLSNTRPREESCSSSESESDREDEDIGRDDIPVLNESSERYSLVFNNALFTMV
jgi:hypothetical protein